MPNVTAGSMFNQFFSGVVLGAGVIDMMTKQFAKEACYLD